MERRVEKGAGPDACWLWLGFQTAHGYGKVELRLRGKYRQLFAHRAMYEAVHGPIPAKISVLHRCDRPLCLNPGHLLLGTSADNTRDMVAKGRADFWGRKSRNRQPVDWIDFDAVDEHDLRGIV